MDVGMPAAGRITPVWVDFFIMLGAFLLILTGVLIWLFYFRKSRKRRRKHRHHPGYRLPNVTLAQKGGLPPIRGEEKPPDPPTPTF
jgi:purine-cytosine permease-like protein